MLLVERASDITLLLCNLDLLCTLYTRTWCDILATRPNHQIEQSLGFAGVSEAYMPWTDRSYIRCPYHLAPVTVTCCFFYSNRLGRIRVVAWLPLLYCLESLSKYEVRRLSAVGSTV